MLWRIYYADATSIEGSDKPKLPGDCLFEVQIIAQEDRENGWQLLHFADYYFWRTDLERWVGVEGDLSAMMALTRHTEEITCVCWGSMMDPDGWAKVMQKAREECHLTARRKHDAVRR